MNHLLTLSRAAWISSGVGAASAAGSSADNGEVNRSKQLNRAVRRLVNMAALASVDASFSR